MLDLAGTIAGNALSLPGILGLFLGMLTRNLAVAAVLGALVGAAETLIFADLVFARVDTLDLAIAITIGILAACIGCLIRRTGATV